MSKHTNSAYKSTRHLVNMNKCYVIACIPIRLQICQHQGILFHFILFCFVSQCLRQESKEWLWDGHSSVFKKSPYCVRPSQQTQLRGKHQRLSQGWQWDLGEGRVGIAVCWSWLTLTCKSQLLSFQEFCKLVVKHGHY